VPTSTDPQRPERLFRAGRAKIDSFDSSEDLYRRCPPTHIRDDGSVFVETFRLPDLSVIRSGASCVADDARWISEEERRTDDPRCYFPEMAVIAVRVKDVPLRVESDDLHGKPHDVQIAHEPFDDHFGHSEVQIAKEGTRLTRPNQLPRLIKTKLRHQLALGSSKVLDPSL
jgi:hypothetical protein